MQIFFLPEGITVALFLVLWFLFSFGAALVCYLLPDRWFAHDGWFFSCHSWEQNGQWYDRVFRVRRWKKRLPDGASWFKNGYKKANITDFGDKNLSQFLLESRRAELTHWFGVAPFWVFGLFAPPFIILVMLAYALAVNLPCIIAQRYNRPRVRRLQRARSETNM